MPAEPPRKPATGFARQFAIAMELPFILVGAVFVGGLFGYYLDRWLGTKPFLMLALGAAGLFAGVREILRRLPKDDQGAGDDASR